MELLGRPKFTSLQVAIYFIERGIRDKSPISMMKLLNLLYIAQGINLVVLERPLFEEKIEAWDFGPTVRIIHKIFSIFGEGPIEDTDYLPVSQNLKSDIDTMRVLDTVWDNFNKGDYVNWLNIEGGPWHQVYYKYINNGIPGSIIPNKLIHDYFIKELDNIRKEYRLY